MAVRMNLWSLTLLPGEKYPLYVRRDFTITNAALGEELRSADGRSVVKVTHNPIPPSAFESDSEYDSELDSDFEDEELDSDEEEEESVDVEDVKPKAKGQKIEVDGEAEDDEDEEDDEEDDSEDDSDLDDDEIEETNVLCSLTAGKTEQATLNLTFVEGEVVMFEATGENAVHLMGNYIDQFPDEFDESDSDYDSEFDGEDDYSDIYGSDDEIELDTEEEEAVAKITAIPEDKPKKAIAPAKAETAAETKPLKRKADAVESPASKAAAAGDVSIDGLSKNQKKKLAKKAKTEPEAAAPAAAAPAKKAEKVEKKPSKVRK